MDIIFEYYYASTIIAGFIIGFLINFTGVGGGVLLVPVLTLIFRLEISMAVGTASLFVTLTKFYAAYEHVKMKTINYRSSLLFLLGAIPGVLIAAGGINYLLSQELSAAEVDDFQAKLKTLIISAIFFSTALIVLEKSGLLKSLKDKESGKYENSILVFFGCVIGLVMGATGIGGGVLIFPTFYLFTKLLSKEIVGSSIFIALVISGITALFYSGGGQADYRTAILLVIGSLAGVFIAGKMIRKASSKVVDYAVIALIFISGIIMYL